MSIPLLMCRQEGALCLTDLVRAAEEADLSWWAGGRLHKSFSGDESLCPVAGGMLASVPQRQDVHCLTKGPRLSGLALCRVWQQVKQECRDPPRHSLTQSLCFQPWETKHAVLLQCMQFFPIIECKWEVFCNFLSFLKFPFKLFYGNSISTECFNK